MAVAPGTHSARGVEAHVSRQTSPEAPGRPEQQVVCKAASFPHAHPAVLP